MKSFIGSLALLTLVSCGKNTEEFLYNEHHRDWQLVQARAAKDCKENSKIFKAFKHRSDFSKYFNQESYYKVKVVKENGAKYNDFIKVQINGKSNMTISYFDTDRESESLSVEFTASLNNALVAAISNGVCDHRKTFQYGHSDLDRSDYLNFSDVRKEGDDSNYKQVTDDFKAVVSYPLALIYWNRSIKTYNKSSGSSETNTYSIEAFSKEKCASDAKCKQTDWRFGSAQMIVDPQAHDSQDLDSVIMELN
ncbi:MAG: hypothetical protein WD025_03465 [Bacteriovoracaceae bacterium]